MGEGDKVLVVTPRKIFYYFLKMGGPLKKVTKEQIIEFLKDSPDLADYFRDNKDALDYLILKTNQAKEMGLWPGGSDKRGDSAEDPGANS